MGVSTGVLVDTLLDWRALASIGRRFVRRVRAVSPFVAVDRCLVGSGICVVTRAVYADHHCDAERLAEFVRAVDARSVAPQQQPSEGVRRQACFSRRLFAIESLSCQLGLDKPRELVCS